MRPPAATPVVAPANDPLSERLLDLLARTTDWLKFAETKNGGIVGLASGGIAALTAAAGFLRELGLQGPAGLALLGGGVLLAAALLIARITVQKLTHFRWAALCFAGGVLLSAAGMLLAIVA